MEKRIKCQRHNTSAGPAVPADRPAIAGGAGRDPGCQEGAHPRSHRSLRPPVARGGRAHRAHRDARVQAGRAVSMTSTPPLRGRAAAPPIVRLVLSERPRTQGILLAAGGRASARERSTTMAPRMRAPTRSFGRGKHNDSRRPAPLAWSRSISRFKRPLDRARERPRSIRVTINPPRIWVAESAPIRHKSGSAPCRAEGEACSSEYNWCRCDERLCRGDGSLRMD
jgi:hypothetical protein